MPPTNAADAGSWARQRTPAPSQPGSLIQPLPDPAIPQDLPALFTSRKPRGPADHRPGLPFCPGTYSGYVTPRSRRGGRGLFHPTHHPASTRLLLQPAPQGSTQGKAVRLQAQLPSSRPGEPHHGLSPSCYPPRVSASSFRPPGLALSKVPHRTPWAAAAWPN